jgi:hypothetical protein
VVGGALHIADCMCCILLTACGADRLRVASGAIDCDWELELVDAN